MPSSNIQDSFNRAQSQVGSAAKARGVRTWLWLAVLLVLANIGFWFWFEPLTLGTDRPQADLVAIQPNAVMTPSAAQGKNSTATVLPTPATEIPPSTASVTNPAKAEGVCLLWGRFDPAQTSAAVASLKQAKLQPDDLLQQQIQAVTLTSYRFLNASETQRVELIKLSRQMGNVLPCSTP